MFIQTRMISVKCLSSSNMDYEYRCQKGYETRDSFSHIILHLLNKVFDKTLCILVWTGNFRLPFLQREMDRVFFGGGGDIQYDKFQNNTEGVAGITKSRSKTFAVPKARFRVGTVGEASEYLLLICIWVSSTLAVPRTSLLFSCHRIWMFKALWIGEPQYWTIFTTLKNILVTNKWYLPFASF